MPPVQSLEVAKLQLPISGMTCQSCANRIQDAVAALPNAKNVRVNFATKSLTAEGLDRDLVVKTIQSVGYDSPKETVGPFQTAQIRKLADEELALAKRHLIVAMIFGIPEFFIGMHWLPGVGPAPVWLEALLTSIVVFYAGATIHKKTIKLLFQQRSVSMDTLVTLGSVAAIVQSYLLWIKDSHHLGFEAGSTIVLFILLGRYLEARSRRAAQSATAELYKILEQPVTVIQSNGTETKVPGYSLNVADRMRINVGEIIPADGIIAKGSAQVDESMLTGEPLPRTVNQGQTVLSGSTVWDSSLEINVTRPGEASFVGKLLKELEAAQSKPANLERIADRITRWFVPAVILLAGITGVAQFLITSNPYIAFNALLSVLLAACPCALGLAIPTALVAGLGAAARRGILFKDPQALEVSSELTDIYFDKTGTLTEGHPQVEEVQLLGGVDRQKALGLAVALNKFSNHPLATALKKAAEADKAPIVNLDQPPKVVPGVGVEGLLEGKSVRLEKHSGADSTASELRIDNQVAAVFTFRDSLRPEAETTLKNLTQRGIKLHLLTGDNLNAANKLLGSLKTYFTSVEASLKPDDKRDHLRAARKSNLRGVGFVGDGINDVLALTEATIGFAVGSGTPAAIGAAPVSLVRGIKDLDLAIEAAAQTRTQIRFNFFWALAYNVVILPWAISANLSPIWASVAMSASSVSVVIGSVLLGLRIKRLS